MKLKTAKQFKEDYGKDESTYYWRSSGRHSYKVLLDFEKKQEELKKIKENGKKRKK